MTLVFFFLIDSEFLDKAPILPKFTSFRWTDKDLSRATGSGAKNEKEGVSRLNRIIQLTGFSDPLYAEAYLLVNQYDIVLGFLSFLYLIVLHQIIHQHTSSWCSRFFFFSLRKMSLMSLSDCRGWFVSLWACDLVRPCLALFGLVQGHKQFVKSLMLCCFVLPQSEKCITESHLNWIVNLLSEDLFQGDWLSETFKY